MNILCKIVLLFFLLFLITPTLVSISKDDVDTSVFYNLAEVENSYDFNESNCLTSLFSTSLVIDFEASQFIKCTSFRQVKLNSVELKLFLIPPESL